MPDPKRDSHDDPSAEAVRRAEPEQASGTAPSEPKPPEQATRARRKRRHKRASRDSGASEWQSLDAQGRERPGFLATFPDDPELSELSRAFEAGDYAHVRAHAPQLAAKTSDDAVRRAALELAERIRPDPLIKYLLLISVLLLLYLVVHAYANHGH